MKNERNAGRKRKIDDEMIREIIQLYKGGRSVSQLAKDYGVSRQTMSFYIHEIGAELEIQPSESVTTYIRSLSYWKKINQLFQVDLEMVNHYRTRMDYMLGKELLTSIFVDFRNEKVQIRNYTDHPLKCAFGVKKNPTWEDFIYFLEDRCVPKTRDHMKLILQDYDLVFYDALSIVERTGGTMAEDNRFIKIYRLELGVEYESI